MNDRPIPVAPILAAAAGLGFAGDQLLRTAGGPGLNFALLFTCLAISVWTVSQSSGAALSREASSWLAVGVLCGATLMWRGSEMLRLGALAAACTAFSLPALDAGRAWLRRSGFLDVAEAMVGAGLHGLLGAARLITPMRWNRPGAEATSGAASTAMRSALGGGLLAAVPLAVFGALFISADQVFATLVGDFVRIDLQAFASHLVAVAALSWLAAGYLVGMSTGTRLDGLRRVAPARPTVGLVEVATALALVDALFLGFVLVQLRYLFGGASWVEVTPGLTYAAYARAGFFQLVAAVALAIPWLLLVHSLVGERNTKARAVVGGLGGLHVVLLLVVVASAVQRMLVYQTAYGLTELRVVVMAVLAWLTLVVIWLGATVLSGRRDRFAFGAVATAFLLAGALQVLDPAGLVARHNLDHAPQLGEVDGAYLASLGSDAAPILIARLGELPEASQCLVANRVLRSWGPERATDWKSFNLSERRARRAVEGELVSLQRLARGGECT